MSSSTPTTQKFSGIQDRGDVRVIPTSRRADGSIRKERMIRPGYTPPEDVARYTNRVLDAARPANSISSMAPRPVPTTTNTNNTPKTKSQLKNEKRKAKRQESASTTTTTTSSSTSPIKPTTGVNTSNQKKDTLKETEKVDAAPNPEPVAVKNPEYQQRNLIKKLNQAKQLKEKQENGEKMLPEQLEKISKIEELQSLIDKLSL
jgi:partner of Y14 and mago protein